MLQSLQHLCSRSLVSLQYVHLTLALGNPGLATALQKSSPWGTVISPGYKRRFISLDLPVTSCLPNAALEAGWLPLPQGYVLLAHGQLGVDQEPPILVCKAASQPVHPQPLLVRGVIPPSSLQDLHCPSIALSPRHRTPVGSFLQPAEVLLNGSTTMWCIKHSSQFYIICKFAEGAFCCIGQIISGLIIRLLLNTVKL